MSYILVACQIMVGVSAILAVVCSIGVWRNDDIRGMYTRNRINRFITNRQTITSTTLEDTNSKIVNEASSTTLTIEGGS